MPSICGLATIFALTAVENKISNVTSLVKKTDYDTKVNEVEKKITDHEYDKYITNSEFNKVTAENFAARLAQANLVTKRDFDGKLIKLDKKITLNKTKHLIVENQLKKLEIFDSIYFHGKSHFEDGGTQKYLVFQPIERYFKRIDGVGNGIYVYYWKSDYGLTPYIDY